MKTLFIPAKLKGKLNTSKIAKLSATLPKNIAIAYSIQYEDIALKIRAILKDKTITSFSQVLGCSKLTFPKATQAILLIGSGKFHAISLAAETNLPICILEKDRMSEISEKDISFYKKSQKAFYMRFLHAASVGILVSTKPGQQNLKKAIEISKKLQEKKPYIFLGNNLNSEECENFAIESWLNTACPRLDFNNFIINSDRLNLG